METNRELKVEATRKFSSSVEELYNAWTSADQLKQWWKPLGNKLKEVENDIKKGGTVEYVFESGLVISGEYLEVQEEQKLVYTWNWNLPDNKEVNADYKLTIDFKSNENGSELYVMQENFKKEEDLQPNKEGWEKGLSDLENFLNSGGSTTTSASESSVSANKESEGYRETPEQVKVGGA